MIALGRSSRSALAGVALIAFAAALATTPRPARGAADAPKVDAGVLPERRTVAPRSASAAVPLAARVVPHRDPFAGGSARVQRTIATAPSALAAVDTRPQLPPMPVAPPAAAAVAPAAPAPRVMAIVTGSRPRALLDEAGTTRIVTVGDVVADEHVSSIGIDGVHLANGSTLPVTPYLAPNGGR